jgi:RimJ/RimL family protein N-acetyltransferase
MLLQLQGLRVILTSASLEDAAKLLPAYNGDEEFNAMSGGTPILSLEGVRADMLETQSIPGGIVWQIADHQHTLIGVAHTALIPPPHTGWIALLIIRQQFQRLGYGRETAQLLEDYLFAQPGITDIGLSVLEQNARALAFWEDRGYIRGLRRHDQHGNNVITLRLIHQQNKEDTKG